MKILNIFLHENDFKKLNDLKEKFKISNSCIIRTTYNYTLKYIEKEKLETELLIQFKQAKRTSIKTNLKNHLLLNADSKKIQTALSNALYLYNRPKEFEEISGKNYKQFKEKLHQAFTKEKDEFYNYTNYIKNQERAKRELKKCPSNKKS